jgi:DNA-binding NtrC family response regulator
MSSPNAARIRPTSAVDRPPILIVDDDPDACTTLARLLATRGYRADTATDGRSALQSIERKQYGLAIIDYRMPGMNGVDLFRRIRRARPSLPGVFLTGYATVDVVYLAVEAGVLRVLAKPVDLDELVPLIEQQLNGVG